ncbi:indolepyruvate ferredoxin oxidoreductase subunit alpha [candidate division WOR-3 bacterium]|nr:indolepyruvate ferredoxin oxidoreductase subunit alpha [candidate division WOR-3 bacterium]
MEKVLLSGNEAVARGAYEADVKVAAAYPGTPSTEIMENIAQYGDIYKEWSVNEKVALEVAAGASMAGARALCAMKHVGLNVAADPLFSMSYIGATGGFVVITADDPGMHSSQNEQDNRHYARAAKIPCLEPSDSQESKDFVIEALDISENFDTPVLMRMTTRVCHSKTAVIIGDKKKHENKVYVKDIKKRIIVPTHARVRHAFVEERTEKLIEFAGKSKLNRKPVKKSDFLVIASGISYFYAREAFPEMDFMKIGMSWPLNLDVIKEVTKKYKKVYVVEENDPFIENELKTAGIKVIGKDVFPMVDELDQEKLQKALKKEKTLKVPVQGLPPRPPALCPGCPHTGVFYAISKLKLPATGDIGCYTLGAFPPLNALDTTVCMGASISNAHGMEKSETVELSKKTVAVIGDSTFFHSGMTGLANMVYNKSRGIVVILDNSTTAMTGHQGHPGTGKTLNYGDHVKIDIEKTVIGLGVKDIHKVDPHDIPAVLNAFEKSLSHDGVSVIIATRPCIFLVPKRSYGKIYIVNHDECVGCRICVGLGCPAISFRENKSNINPMFCAGCGLCASLCPKKAIKINEGVENGQE